MDKEREVVVGKEGVCIYKERMCVWRWEGLMSFNW